MIESDPKHGSPQGYIGGKHHFKHPFVMRFGGDYRSEDNWKAVLSQQYGGKRGLELTRALISDGYDGIITIDDSGTNEIVSFHTVREA